MRSRPAELGHVVRLRGLVAMLVGVTALLGLAQTSPGHSLLRLAGLVKAPEAYSALYFANPDALPKVLSAERAGLPVSFVIHNASQESGDYRWLVQFVRGKTTRSVAVGRVTIPRNGTRQERVVVRTSCSRGELIVVVRLLVPAESIDFRVACSA